MTKKVVFAFDSSIDINIEEYQKLINMCRNSKVYILSTDNETIKGLYNIINDNVVVIDFYKEIKSNKNYLEVDKIHLTDEGNKLLSEILKNSIK